MTDLSSARRGIVEALFILVSILLAFWIDAWWDERQDAGMERAMLGAVAEELARNEEAIAANIARLDAYLDRIDRLLRASDAALLALPQDSVVAWVGALPGRASFNGDLEATTMLLQSPAVDSEGSLAVRARLATWRNDIDEAELLGGQLDQAAIRVNRLLARYAARSASDGDAGVARMAASRRSRAGGNSERRGSYRSPPQQGRRAAHSPPVLGRSESVDARPCLCGRGIDGPLATGRGSPTSDCYCRGLPCGHALRAGQRIDRAAESRDVRKLLSLLGQPRSV